MSTMISHLLVNHKHTERKPHTPTDKDTPTHRHTDRNTQTNTHTHPPTHTHTHTVRENYITKTKRTTRYENENTETGKGESQSRNMKFTQVFTPQTHTKSHAYTRTPTSIPVTSNSICDILSKRSLASAKTF